MKIKNISKTYKIQNAEDVKALKEVSFDLPETGMVFVLGKSGCGKSTLLNLLGGMDVINSGDIEYHGKKFSQFKQRDFDNYRNTCCGFVFQEYNLIAELTVGENIALALQLQGEKNTDDKVATVLKQVELENYQNRKIIELSGGQKQRVTIARALVKNPNIIFADEPTGALDSQTGESILSLLKEISKTKLVVVVSHDRDFAEKFGDRIIELSDGQVIFDSQQGFESDEGKKKLKIKKPNMPTMASLKIGCSNFRLHPYRLLSTIVIAVLAFSLLAMTLGALSKDFSTVVYESLEDNGVEICGIKKNKYAFSAKATQGDKEIFDDIYGVESLGMVQKSFEFLTTKEPFDVYHCFLPSNYVCINQNQVQNFGFVLDGVLPTNSRQVAISKYSSQALVAYGVLQENQDAIGQSIVIDQEQYEIVGIIDTLVDENKYNPLKSISITDKQTQLSEVFAGEMTTSLHNALFVCPQTVEEKKSVALPLDFELLKDGRDRVAFVSKVFAYDQNASLYPIEQNVDGNYLSILWLEATMGFVPCNEVYKGNQYDDYGALVAMLKTEYNDETNLTEKNALVFERLKKEFGFAKKIQIDLVNQNYQQNITLTIDGFFDGDDFDLMLNSKTFVEIEDLFGGEYIRFFVPIKTQNFKNLIDGKDGFVADDFVISQISLGEQIVNVINAVSRIVAIVMLVFSCVLLIYFITQSLFDRIKTVGVLKSFGCNTFNLAKIFMWESILIGGCVFVLSLVFGALACGAVNALLSGGVLVLKFFKINFGGVIALFACSVGFSLCGCIVSILRLSKLNPTDFAKMDIG